MTCQLVYSTESTLQPAPLAPFSQAGARDKNRTNERISSTVSNSHAPVCVIPQSGCGISRYDSTTFSRRSLWLVKIPFQRPAINGARNLGRRGRNGRDLANPQGWSGPALYAPTLLQNVVDRHHL